jgi:hypothetical protein
LVAVYIQGLWSSSGGFSQNHHLLPWIRIGTEDEVLPAALDDGGTGEARRESSGQMGEKEEEGKGHLWRDSPRSEASCRGLAAVSTGNRWWSKALAVSWCSISDDEGLRRCSTST